MVNNNIYGSLIVRLKREMYIRGVEARTASESLGIRHETFLEYMRGERYMPMVIFCRLSELLELFPILVDLGIVELMEYTYGSLYSEIDKNFLDIKKISDSKLSICDKTKAKRENGNKLIKMELETITTKYKKSALKDTEFSKDANYKKPS